MCQKNLLITLLCKWIVEKSLKETIGKNTMNGHVCSRGPFKHDEYFGYVSNPIVPRRCWAPGYMALGLTKPMFFKAKTSGTFLSLYR